QRRAALEPFAVSPGLQYCLGVGIAGLGFFSDVVERIEHQQGVLELFGSRGGQFGIVQQFDQSGDVVAALHGAQQLNSALLADQRRGGFALGDGRQEAGLDIGCFVNASGDAVGDQVNQESFFAGWRVLQQLDQACGLFGVQRLGNDTLSGTLCYMFAVGFKHSLLPSSLVPWVFRDAHPEAVFKVLRGLKYWMRWQEGSAHPAKPGGLWSGRLENSFLRIVEPKTAGQYYWNEVAKLSDGL